MKKTKQFAVHFIDSDTTKQFKWEQDEQGNHRLIDLDGTHVSQWAGPDGIAYLPDLNVAVFSDYWLGVLPIETLLHLKTFDLISEQIL